MIQWISLILVPFGSAVLGGIFALLGSFITIRFERKKIEKANIDRAKPIIINRTMNIKKPYETGEQFDFFAAEGSAPVTLVGNFRNTDNAITFLDHVESDNKKYIPKVSAAIDKNTDFSICLHNVEKENFKNCRIYCHDIHGRQYFYEAKFCFERGMDGLIIISEIQSVQSGECENRKG